MAPKSISSTRTGSRILRVDDAPVGALVPQALRALSFLTANFGKHELMKPLGHRADCLKGPRCDGSSRTEQERRGWKAIAEVRIEDDLHV